jgi:hypothetical protein
VTYAKRVRRITLERYIVSKIVFQLEKVTTGEILVLYDNILWCQDKAGKDPSFREKFGSSLEDLALILKSVRFTPATFHSNLSVLSVAFRNKLDGFYIPAKNLQGVYVHVRGTYHILPSKSQGIEKRRLPPPRYIGVGYKDKGHRRDEAYDGSPTWQEVAMRLKT